MPSYDWREFHNRPWIDRYPAWVRGYGVWREADTSAAPAALAEARRGPSSHPVRPCVFVSHRQKDIAPALRIAYLACKAGFDFWLDVLNPVLTKLPGVGPSGPTPALSASAIAAVIEMGLLNSTHVVAVITPRTKGSMWVPYEYGRVKKPVLRSLEAACWVDAVIPDPDLPEYLHLGVVTRNEGDVSAWLTAEAASHGVAPGGCSWSAVVPASL